jgi:hypothetical protein
MRFEHFRILQWCKNDCFSNVFQAAAPRSYAEAMRRIKREIGTVLNNVLGPGHQNVHKTVGKIKVSDRSHFGQH